MRLSLILIFSGALSFANTLTNSTFGQPETNCNYTQTAPYTTPTCPVIGAPSEFNIESISVTVAGDNVTATIDFNYGGGQSLAPFVDGNVTLQPGDLFFYDPTDPTQKLLYGVAVDSTRPHSNPFIAGDLYQLGGNVSVETAASALNNPNAYYRPTDPVLMTDTNGTPSVAGIGDGVKVAPLGNGTTAADYSVTLQFTAPQAFVDLFQNGSIGVDFASADCGNAILEGNTVGTTTNNSAAPEPQDATLMALGIGLMAAAGYWRKKSTRRG
jgi:hypothetical protein